MHNGSDLTLKKKLLKQQEKVNSKQNFLEFPIHLIYEDDFQEFINPLDRSHIRDPTSQFTRRISISEQQNHFLSSYPGPKPVPLIIPNQISTGQEAVQPSQTDNKSLHVATADTKHSEVLVIPAEFKPIKMPGSHFSFN